MEHNYGRKTYDNSHSSVMQLAKRIRDVALLQGSFKLRSGVVTDQYFDKYLFESDPELLQAIVKHMSPLIPPGAEILAGLEMGGIPIVTALSQLMNIPSAFIRKEVKLYGTCKFAEGPELLGKEVVLIEDVVSSGGAILDALDNLRNIDVEPIAAVCVIDRQTGGQEKLAAAGIELFSVLKMEEILNAI